MAQSVDEAVRGLRVSVAGMIAGVVVFAVVVVIMRIRLAPTSPIPRVVLLGGLGAFALGAAAAYSAQHQKLVRDLTVRASELRQMADPSTAIIGPYRGFAIVGAGLIEGPCFLALMIYFLTGDVIAIAAAALGVILLVLHLPSRAALERVANRLTQR